MNGQVEQPDDEVDEQPLSDEASTAEIDGADQIDESSDIFCLFTKRAGDKAKFCCGCHGRK